MTDLLLAVVGITMAETIRSQLKRRVWPSLTAPGFDINRNTLNLIHNQTLFWVGFFFSPLLPAVIVIKMYFTFHIKKVSQGYNLYIQVIFNEQLLEISSNLEVNEMNNILRIKKNLRIKRYIQESKLKKLQKKLKASRKTSACSSCKYTVNKYFLTELIQVNFGVWSQAFSVLPINSLQPNVLTDRCAIRYEDSSVELE